MIALLWIAFFIAGPVAFLWSLNTIFALGAPLTFKTWVAALVLGSILTGGRRR